jgi:HEPN domain-containing protein
VTSEGVARDYLRRAQTRRLALDTFLAAGIYGDVMRETQEIVELVLKGTLRFVGVEPPKRHDVHDIVERFLGRLPAEWVQVVGELRTMLDRLAAERGRAFYGDEVTGTPSSELYGPDDAQQAVAIADRLLAMYGRLLGEEGAGESDE